MSDETPTPKPSDDDHNPGGDEGGGYDGGPGAGDDAGGGYAGGPGAGDDDVDDDETAEDIERS
jgi:hypothetical protein